MRPNPLLFAGSVAYIVCPQRRDVGHDYNYDCGACTDHYACTPVDIVDVVDTVRDHFDYAIQCSDELRFHNRQLNAHDNHLLLHVLGLEDFLNLENHHKLEDLVSDKDFLDFEDFLGLEELI